MTTIPMLPDLDPDYEQTIDEVWDEAERLDPESFRGRCAQREVDRRRSVRDAILDLQDQLNDARLAIVPVALVEAAENFLKEFEAAWRDPRFTDVPNAEAWSFLRDAKKTLHDAFYPVAVA